MSDAARQTFRFRPRFRGLALSAMGLGAILLVIGLLVDQSRTLAMGGGAVGLALGALYLASPIWRFRVLVDEEALEVRSSRGLRFRLPWSEIAQVTASPRTQTCFVDGGHPERSLLVPGPGASAPYDIENKGALFDVICARTPAGRVHEVDLLETARGQGDTARQPGDTAPDAHQDQGS